MKKELDHKQAINWARSYLEHLGLQPQGEFVKVSIMPWSNVYSVVTSIGVVYLKQVAHPFVIEAKLVLYLHDLFPSLLPEMLGQNEALRCFLMRDAGIPMRNVLQPNYQVAIAKRAVTACASIQLGCINHVDSLLTLGVPDWRLATLPFLYCGLLKEQPFLKKDGLTQTDIDKLQAYLPSLTELCNRLLQYNIPETIEHSDFHDKNILLGNNNTLIVNDWGEAVISHPFFSIISFFYCAARTHNIKESSKIYNDLRDHYLNYWLAFESKDRLLEALELAKRLSYIKYALSFYRITQLPGWADLGQNVGRISGALKELIKEIDKVV